MLESCWLHTLFSWHLYSKVGKFTSVSRIHISWLILNKILNTVRFSVTSCTNKQSRPSQQIHAADVSIPKLQAREKGYNNEKAWNWQCDLLPDMLRYLAMSYLNSATCLIINHKTLLWKNLSSTKSLLTLKRVRKTNLPGSHRNGAQSWKADTSRVPRPCQYTSQDCSSR